MPWVHKIDRFEFQFWDGDSPDTPRQQVETFQRAGVNGTGFRMLGERGQPFDAQLTAHLVNYALTRPLLKQYETLIGASPVEAWFNYRRLLTDWQVKFEVLDVAELDCRVNVRLIGPGYNYLGGASLVTRWRLLPVAA
jgi:hypothetical protein